ncbi:MAG: fasciclin domain-containing protein, partial [Croceitalea sp.]|nr:fasciclin domain-containing protein [Croceitalea sp.]NNL07893.1 fasciclin domain-containing protein [Croceitalea sp.]NNM17097.1 fasciclin domain-containing protein [Croceitalea sp.]
MKIASNLFKVFSIALTLSFMACSDDDNGGTMIEQESTTVVDLAIASDDLGILVEALTS